MKVREVMTRPVEACTPGADLSAAAAIMWSHDCGAVPVVSEESGKVLGVITDRDICIAVATRQLRPGELQVRDVFSGKLHKVRPNDDVRVALERMKNERVRRLPVVGPDGTLQGMVSISDLILRAESAHGRTHPPISADDILEVLKSICEHPAAMPPGVHEEVATLQA